MSLGTYTFKLDDTRVAPIHILTHKGREVWIAGEIGAALGYANPADLSKKVGSEWADEFAVDCDFFKVEGEDLDALKRLGAEVAPSDPIIHPRTPSLLLLTESGVNLACTLARTPAARLFRRWLADEVLPSIRRTGSYVAPSVHEPQQGILFGEGVALPPFTPSASPHVALKGLNILRRDKKITAHHYHEQLAVLVGRITGQPVALMREPQDEQPFAHKRLPMLRLSLHEQLLDLLQDEASDRGSLVLDGLSVRELGRRLGRTPAVVRDQLDILERKGLIQQQTHLGGPRSRVITLVHILTHN